jgi:hypothetical protein
MRRGRADTTDGKIHSAHRIVVCLRGPKRPRKGVDTLCEADRHGVRQRPQPLRERSRAWWRIDRAKGRAENISYEF